MADWCILQTSPSSTVRLAASLREAGIDAWTPVEVQERRVGRARKRVDVLLPITPTFVFAPLDRMGELLEQSHSPARLFRVWDAELRRMVTKGCPFFRVFRHAGEYPSLSEAQLAPLRHLEMKLKRPPKPKQFALGQRVRLIQPRHFLEGMSGLVSRLRGNSVEVEFTGWHLPLVIASGYLSAVDMESAVNVNRAASEQAQVAD